jgi:hypothetical protein
MAEGPSRLVGTPNLTIIISGTCDETSEKGRLALLSGDLSTAPQHMALVALKSF